MMLSSAVQSSTELLYVELHGIFQQCTSVYSSFLSGLPLIPIVACLPACLRLLECLLAMYQVKV